MHPPTSPVLPFLLTQNLSPKDVAYLGTEYNGYLGTEYNAYLGTEYDGYLGTEYDGYLGTEYNQGLIMK